MHEITGFRQYKMQVTKACKKNFLIFSSPLQNPCIIVFLDYYPIHWQFLYSLPENSLAFHNTYPVLKP